MSAAPVALEDIAKSLGLAVSTVSRAMRKLPGIHPTTRAKIIQQAESMGYVAPRKSKGETVLPRNILLLTMGADEPPAGYMAGMSRVAPLASFAIHSHVSTVEDSWNVLDPKLQPPALKMGLVAGIILIYKWPDEIVSALSKKWPTISLVMHYPDTPIDVVGIDHLSGTFPLVKHLKEMGHERIGFFGLCPDISWARSRFGAYAEAMIAYGLPLNFDDVVQIEDVKSVVKFPYLDEAAVEKLVRKISRGVRAWMCANDVIANSVCASLLRRGVRIPEDVSVTGFHRRPYPLAHLPALTTTEVRDDLLGEEAIRRIEHRLEYPKEPPRLILMSCSFLQGETTGPIDGAKAVPVAASQVA